MAAGDITVTTVVTGSTTGGVQLKGFTNSKIYSSINDVIEREITVPTSEVQILGYGATVGGMTLNSASINHFEFKNLDATNYVSLAFKSGTDQFYVKVKPGEHFVMNNGELDASATTVAFSAWVANTTVYAIANTAACKCSYVAF